MTLLVDEARALEMEDGPWRVGDFDDLLIASFGTDYDGKHIYLLASPMGDGQAAGPRKDAEFCAWCRNHWGSILSALEMTVMPAGTDTEKADAMRKLASWNRGEPIRSYPDPAEMVLPTESEWQLMTGHD